MAPGNNNDRIRRAAERSTPPLPPEVRRRALWAAMTVLRRKPSLRTAILVSVALLVLAAGVYALVR